MKSNKRNVLKPLLFIGLGLVAATFAIARDPFDVPGIPGTPVMKNTSTSSCTIKYTAPRSDGGSPIITYLIEYSGNWDPFWWDGGASVTLEHKVQNLIEGNRYEFRVIAVNKAGQGNPSDPSKFIVIQ